MPERHRQHDRRREIADRPDSASSLFATRGADHASSVGFEARADQGIELDAATRGQMEQSFGHSFANVRIHATDVADRAARSIGARAFTVGSDVYFQASEDPATFEGGHELLAHELAHVVQNERFSRSEGAAPLSAPNDSAEQEAEQSAAVVAGGGVAEVASAPTALVARASKEEQHFMGDMSSVLKFTKGILGADIDNMLDSESPNKSILKEVPGIGYGMDFLSESLSRGKRGQGMGEAMGGGIVSGLTSMLLDQKSLPGILQPLMGGLNSPDWGKLAGAENPAEAFKDSFSAGPASQLKDFAGAKGLSTGMGIAGSGLKLLSSIVGEADHSSDFQIKDAGEYLDVGSKFASPAELAKSGVKEGMQGLYNTAVSTGDWLATGSTSKFMQQGEDQLKGKTGPITQGYSMLANLVGSAATGDYSEMTRIGNMSSKGELGALPKLGSKLGDATYDISEVAGAGLGMIGDLFSGDTKNIENRRELMAVNNPLGKAVNSASDWLGDKMWSLFGDD